jgi:MFS family permease
MEIRLSSQDSAAGRLPEQWKVRRVALAGLLGTTLEQYDFVIYGTASALIFNGLFFPNVSPAIGVIASFATYAVGFGARPLGGLFFSRFGDRYGRKWVLVMTLLLMGLSTLAIGVLPTYRSAGIWAPVLLVACRLLQGFGAGAEQAGGVVLLCETAARERRGRLSSLVYVGAAAGNALGALVWLLVELLPPAELESWGWRLVFIASVLVTIAALIMRRKLDESPVFQEVKATRAVTRAPVAEVFRHGRPALARVFFMMLGVSAHSNTFQVFMASYLVTAVGVSKALVPRTLLVGALAACVAAYLAGAAADRFGRRVTYLVITGALVVLPIPAFLMLNTGITWVVYVVMVLGYMLAAEGAPGAQAGYFPELFGSRYRYAGVTVGREFSAVLGGGIAPMICSGLLAAFSNSWWPVAIYMMIMMCASFLGAWFSPETRGRDLNLPEDAQRARPGKA